MMSYRWFIRMSRWARNPPSATQVKLVLGVILACFVLFGYEWMFGWPEWLTLDQGGGPHRLPRP